MTYPKCSAGGCTPEGFTGPTSLGIVLGVVAVVAFGWLFWGHQIYDWFARTPERFRRMLRWLSSRGHQTPPAPDVATEGGEDRQGVQHHKEHLGD